MDFIPSYFPVESDRIESVRVVDFNKSPRPTSRGINYARLRDVVHHGVPKCMHRVESVFDFNKSLRQILWTFNSW